MAPHKPVISEDRHHHHAAHEQEGKGRKGKASEGE
jgi:hypothetical protein